jgi:hypothetical protein
MRRRANESAEVPLRLRRFRPRDWPGADVMARFEAWRSARYAYATEHRGALTPLDAVRGVVAERRWALGPGARRGTL